LICARDGKPRYWPSKKWKIGSQQKKAEWQHPDAKSRQDGEHPTKHQ
jgi:hypothetical protein